MANSEKARVSSVWAQIARPIAQALARIGGLPGVARAKILVGQVNLAGLVRSEGEPNPVDGEPAKGKAGRQRPDAEERQARPQRDQSRQIHEPATQAAPQDADARQAWLEKNKAERAKLWPQPDPARGRWQNIEERRVQQAVERAFGALTENGGAPGAIMALRKLASKAPSHVNATHLQWIDGQNTSSIFDRQLVSLAAEAGNAEALGALLEMGADPNASDLRGRPPMWHAAQFARKNGVDPRPRALDGLSAAELAERVAKEQKALATTEKIMRRLLEAGADANGRGNEVSDKAWRPILFDVAGVASLRLTQLLIDFGADASLKTDRGDPLLAVLSANQPKCAVVFEALVKAGAELEARSRVEDTALISAARWHNLDAARELLRLGARTDALSHEGLDWLSVARKTMKICPRGPEAAGAFMAFFEERAIQEEVETAISAESAGVAGPEQRDQASRRNGARRI